MLRASKPEERGFTCVCRIFDRRCRGLNLRFGFPADLPSPDPEPRMDNTMPILLVPGLVCSPRIYAPVDAGPVAVRPGDGRQPHPRRQYGRDRAPDPGRGAAALCARRAFDGRLHRLRDHAAGAGAGGQTGADQHPGAARYAGGHRPPPRHDGPRARRRIPRRARRAVSRASCIPRGATMPACASSSTTWATMSGSRASSRQQTAVIEPAGLAADAGLDQMPDAGPDRATRTTPSRIRCRWRWPSGIHGAKLVILPNCGHLPQPEQPQATADALVEWLRS